MTIFTLVSLSCGIYFICRGNVRAHRRFMIGTFVGLVVAGLGALGHDRLLGELLLGG